jgi:hypothetical protein
VVRKNRRIEELGVFYPLALEGRGASRREETARSEERGRKERLSIVGAGSWVLSALVDDWRSIPFFFFCLFILFYFIYLFFPYFIFSICVAGGRREIFEFSTDGCTDAGCRMEWNGMTQKRDGCEAGC